jgi:hypothetical protein
MKRIYAWNIMVFLGFLWLAVARPFPVAADEYDLDRLTKLNEHWRIVGYWRARLEVTHFFDPKSTALFRNNYTYPALLGRLGLQFNYPWIEGLAEGQVTGLWNLPGAADGYGPGASYFANRPVHNQARVFLHQGYLRFKPPFLPGLAIQPGRFEYFMEDEFKTGDAAMDFLRSIRIGQRLVGPFGFSHVWRSFDGILASYNDPHANITFTASHPTQGGFDIGGMEQMSHIDLLTGVATLKAGALLPHTEFTLFHVTYHDARGVTPSDNRVLAGLPRPSLNIDPLEIYTMGGHFLGVYPVGLGAMDALAWGAGQWGHWGNQRHQAFAYALEGGYQFRQAPWKPWLRLGWFMSSGDPDPTDGVHETFFQILPTARLYAFFPFYNLMNNEDLFFQVFLYPYEQGFIRFDYHSLWLTEGSDLWYFGAGATRRDLVFGYSGRDTGGRRSLAQVPEITFRHTFNKYLWVELYYGHAFGGTAVDKLFKARQADFFFVEWNLKF